jgi:hypothetical protein
MLNQWNLKLILIMISTLPFNIHQIGKLKSTESPLKESTESPHGRVWFELSGRNLPIFAVDTEKVEPHF